MRELITFECTACHRRNYTSFKNKQKNKERLTLNKFCRWCRKHLPHKEIK